MEILKYYKAVIATVIIVLVLVIIRSTGVKHFKNDAIRWAEPSFTQANIVTPEQVRDMKGNNLIINLDNNMMHGYEITGDLKNIPADSVLNKNITKSILRHSGPVLIYSTQPGLAARIWMILSQMGCKKIYILTDKADNEIFKYKFRPDTLISGPEYYELKK